VRDNGWIVLALLLAAGLTLTAGGYIVYANTADSIANEKKYAAAIAAAEKANGIPPGLLHRQLYEESHFRTDIIDGATISPGGAVGIAQLLPRYYASVDPTDPIQSINAAAQTMRQYYRRFGSWRLALAAYNWGPTALAIAITRGETPAQWPRETQAYVAQITADVAVA